MQAYVKALGGENTYMVLSPDSSFFDFFNLADPPLTDQLDATTAPSQAE
jgi:hypothetical protein